MQTQTTQPLPLYSQYTVRLMAPCVWRTLASATQAMWPTFGNHRIYQLQPAETESAPNVIRLLSAETECPPEVPIYSHSAPKPKPKPKFGRPLVFRVGGSNGAIYGSNKSKMIGGHRHVGKISSGDISATSRPIHFMFCSRVEFFGDSGSNGAIFDSNKLKMAAAAILDNFEWPYLRNGSRSTYIARIARSSLR